MSRGRPKADAVMARRRTPLDALDYFPTPPWAARAFVQEWLLPLCGDHPRAAPIWEPAAGGGHMVGVLRESFDQVFASDVHDWGPGFAQGSFVGGGLEAPALCPFQPAWIITNPPFNLGIEFARQALATASQGVALLMRTGWAEGVTRYNALFGCTPPSFVIQYAERVPMVQGRWDPDAVTATAYAWFVWDRASGADTRFRWLPPGRETRWTLPTDRARYAGAVADAGLPLLEDPMPC